MKSRNKAARSYKEERPKTATVKDKNDKNIRVESNTPSQENCVFEKPLISVVVPVYNVADYLPLCFDSLLFQTMREIEIIVVNDGSPDNSQEIIDKYVQMFPGRIKSLQKENGGLSSARKYGFEHVQAPYVLFLDSDDYIDYHTCELLYAKAIETEADVVYCPAYSFDEGNQKYEHFGKLKRNTFDELIVKGKASLCGLLLRVDYVKNYKIFENMVYEDAATSMAMISHTKKVAFIDAPCYAYIINRSGSLTYQNKRTTAADTVKADELVWLRCEAKQRPLMAARVMSRIVGSAKNIYQVYDLVVQHAKAFAYKLMPYEETVAKYCGRGTIKSFNNLLLEPDEMMAMNVYLNGFDTSVSKEEYIEHVNMPFIGDYEVVWLDDETCDMAQAPESICEHYKNGRKDVVAAWFATKRIQQSGGVFIGKDIRVVSTFNRMRFDKAFFGFASNRSFNGQVFGGQPDQKVWDILAYMLERNGIDSCEQAMGLALCGWGGAHLNGKSQTLRDDVKVYKSNVFTFCTERFVKRNVCVYLPKMDSPEAYMEFFTKGYDELHSYLQEPSLAVTPSGGNVKTVGNSQEVAALKRERDQARAELSQMKNTLSWRITRPLRFCRTLIRKVTKK